jgi:hypothetical protein
MKAKTSENYYSNAKRFRAHLGSNPIESETTLLQQLRVKCERGCRQIWEHYDKSPAHQEL